MQCKVCRKEIQNKEDIYSIEGHIIVCISCGFKLQEEEYLKHRGK